MLLGMALHTCPIDELNRAIADVEETVAELHRRKTRLQRLLLAYRTERADHCDSPTEANR